MLNIMADMAMDFSTLGFELGICDLDDGTAMCLKCQKKFRTVAQARLHYREVHMTDATDRRFQCQLCPKAFAVKRYLNNHVRSIHGLSQSLIKRNYIPN